MRLENVGGTAVATVGFYERPGRAVDGDGVTDFEGWVRTKAAALMAEENVGAPRAVFILRPPAGWAGGVVTRALHQIAPRP